MAAERRKVIDELSAQSRALGGGDTAILREIERGEDYLVEEWKRVLGDERMSAEAMAVVRPCYKSVRRGHDRAKQLRDVLATAS